MVPAMRSMLRLLLALTIATCLTAPALADKGGVPNGGNGNGNGNSGGQGNGNGNGNGGGNNGNGNGNNGNAGNNGGGNGANAASNGNNARSSEPTLGVIVAVPDDQQVVREAVRARAALSLEAITAVVAGDTDGRILDLQLVTFNGIYLYDVTVLEQDGVLHKLYYNARSGVRVRTD